MVASAFECRMMRANTFPDPTANCTAGSDLLIMEHRASGLPGAATPPAICGRNSMCSPALRSLVSEQGNIDGRLWKHAKERLPLSSFPVPTQTAHANASYIHLAFLGRHDTTECGDSQPGYRTGNYLHHTSTTRS
jgi:hypothetical protein